MDQYGLLIKYPSSQIFYIHLTSRGWEQLRLHPEVANCTLELNCVKTASTFFSSKYYMQWNMAEFAIVSSHYTFCAHHRSYTALLGLSFLDQNVTIFSSLCFCSGPQIICLEGPAWTPCSISSFIGCLASSELESLAICFRILLPSHQFQIVRLLVLDQNIDHSVKKLLPFHYAFSFSFKIMWNSFISPHGTADSFIFVINVHTVTGFVLITVIQTYINVPN